jgi:hypothetical protein
MLVQVINTAVNPETITFDKSLLSGQCGMARDIISCV